MIIGIIVVSSINMMIIPTTETMDDAHYIHYNMEGRTLLSSVLFRVGPHVRAKRNADVLSLSFSSYHHTPSAPSPLEKLQAMATTLGEMMVGLDPSSPHSSHDTTKGR